jgi:Oxidoreductase family, NAD-binding Rossmann fold
VLRIGIVGAENSHSKAIAETINVQRKLRGVAVTALWGEKRKWALDVAGATEIPTIVRQPQDMIGLVDAVILDHRDGKFHLPAAMPLLKAGLPLFIDKPFCCRLSEGKRFLDYAQKLKVPVCSFGVMPLQASFSNFLKKITPAKIGKLLSLTTSGPADLYSKYSGVFFYGIHQIEMITRAAGLEFTHARLNRSGHGGSATLWRNDGLIATVNLLAKNCSGFYISAIGEKGTVSEEIKHDSNPYLSGIRNFVKLFKTGKSPLTRREILAPIAILEAMGKSLKGREKKVKIGRF